ncbi:TolB family protein [Bdellovibrio bacteriovorus]
MKILIAIGSLFFLLGCSHISVTKNLLTPDYLLAKDSKQLTFIGDHAHPRFSFDNKKILFSRLDKNNHRGWQIYELDLTSNKVRRVTYSDGDAFDGSYISESEIIYASTTDEIKESPLLNKTFDKDSPPSDLYMSDLFGTDILRITHQPGYDGEPLFVSHPSRPAIFFSSRREVVGIYRIDLKSLPVTVVASEKDKEKRFAAITPDQNSLVWVDKNLKTSEQKLRYYDLRTKTALDLKGNEGDYKDLIFAPRPPARLFYSVLRKGEKYYQIEVYNLEKKCTQVVFKGTDSLSGPAISSETPEKLAFLRTFEDKKQIYMLQLPDDLGPCLEASAQATLKE